MIHKAAHFLCAAFLVVGSMAEAKGPKLTPVGFDQLDGWEADDHAAALATFLKSCAAPRENKLVLLEDWSGLCEMAQSGPDPKTFFEMFFQPVLIEDNRRTLFTGYYEPEIPASRNRSSSFQHPIFKRPKEMVLGQPWKTRAEIESGALSGRGLELAWLEDPVENFFLHVQGSGRLKLNDGGAMRVGFDGKNGHPYRSVGKELIRLGILNKNKVSAQGIKAWVRKNPAFGRQILQHNPSFVFFRELKGLDETAGPPGAMRVSVTMGRTIAVDPKFSPLGAPVWIEKRGGKPMNRLMIAQDVGSAIKGAQRADIFYGTGKEAGKIAGRTKSAGRMYTLLPLPAVRRLLPEGL